VKLSPTRASRQMTLFGATLALGAMACATAHHLDGASLRSSRPKTLFLAFNTRDRVSGAMMRAPIVKPFYTPSPLMALAVVAAIAEELREAERQFARDNKIEDPSRSIGERIGRSLVSDYGLSLVEAPPGKEAMYWPRPNDDETIDWSPPAELVLEINTTELSIEEGPTHWNKQKLRNDNRVWLHYEVELRLVDTRRTRVLVEGTCELRDPRLDAVRNARSTDEVDAALSPMPTLKDMLKPDAQRLIAELDGAGDRCERELRSNVLGLGPPPPRPPTLPAPVTPSSTSR
jgi:hypothetical protein